MNSFRPMYNLYPRMYENIYRSGFEQYPFVTTLAYMNKHHVSLLPYRESIYRADHRVVNFIKFGGGDPLCTVHRGEGLYVWVRCSGYSLLKT